VTADPPRGDGDDGGLPDWERDLNERVVRWARGGLPPDHPDRPARTEEDPS
jgi:hypothetical protein